MSHIAEFLPYGELQRLALERAPKIEISEDGYWVINGVKTEVKAEVEVPVQSVNGQTGDVTLTANDVGARPNTWTPTAAEVKARPDTWTPTYSEVGADKSGTASSAVSGHNTNTEAHNDIRLELIALADRINAALDSDDKTLDELSEIVAYIKSNKGLIDAITASKVNVADIIDDLETNVSTKPLSAAQGVALKGFINALSTGKLDVSALSSAINTALAQAKASGEFDGAPGKDGEDGKDGVTPTIEISSDGYWVINGTKTNTKAAGTNGDDGEDGVGISSITKTGTSGKVDTYTITLSDGTKTTFNVTNGADGKDGEDGETPVKYVDYFTPTDINDMVDAVIKAIGTPIFGLVGDDNKIILSGNGLDNGEYSIYYDMGDNNEPEYIGALEIDNNEYVTVYLSYPNCTVSNNKTQAAKGTEYTNTITVNPNYKITSITVTMVDENGETRDISTDVVIGNVITIGNVTGTIAISVTTVADAVNYSVTNALTKCSTDNSDETTVAKGNDYSATISADANCVITSITVTMGGTNITSSAVSGNAISIGNVTGNIVITAKAVTNQIPISTDSDVPGDPLIGENGEIGYKTGYRVSTSSGVEKKEAPNYELTGFIPCTWNSTLYIKNITVDGESVETCGWYDTNKGFITGTLTNAVFGNTTGATKSKTISTVVNDALEAKKDSIAYFRFTANTITPSSIVTVDEPIS